MHATNHNHEYFLSHFACEPERWLCSGTDLAKQEQLASAKAAHSPFSLGTRGCLAKSLDLTVLELTAVTVI
jgi:cytochrome P450